MNVWNYEKISQFWFLPLVACLILGIEYFVVVKLYANAETKSLQKNGYFKIGV